MMSDNRGWISIDARRMDLYIYILPLYVYGVCVVVYVLWGSEKCVLGPGAGYCIWPRQVPPRYFSVAYHFRIMNHTSDALSIL